MKTAMENEDKKKVVKKVFTLGVLYFVQGLPYGFQDKFVPVYLRSAGLSHTKLAMMKLLLLPWLCKAAYAPFLDLFWTKWFWLLCSLCGLSVFSFLGILIQPENFVSVSVWLFILNLFSAVQDIAVDGLALMILRHDEIGHGNTVQVLGYKIGALCGGGILFWIHVYYGWTGLCMSFFGFYVSSILMFLPLYAKNEYSKTEESHTDDYVDATKGQEHSDIPESDSELKKRHVMSGEEKQVFDKTKTKVQSKDFYKLFASLFKTEGTMWLIFFLFIYKLGERGALSTFPLFLIDKGVTTKQLSLWSGLVGQTSSLLGSVFSGWLIAGKWKIAFLLNCICIARSLPILLQWVIINLWPSYESGFLYEAFLFFSVISLISLEFTAGMATTAIFSLMMSCSLRAPTAVQGTHYSVLSSVEVAGKLLFSSFIGAFIDWLGLPYIYFNLVVLSFATLLIVPWIDGEKNSV